MGALTDFFTASKGELAGACRGWLTVAETPVKREFKNPFTGKSQIVDHWEPESPVSEGPAAASPIIQSLPHCEFKRVDHVKLAKLDQLLSGVSFADSIAEIGKPALIHPNSEDCGLHELPGRLIAALSGATDETINTVAATWAQADEMKADRIRVEDCVQVLNALHSVSRAATERNATVYFYWSL